MIYDQSPSAERLQVHDGTRARVVANAPGESIASRIAQSSQFTHGDTLNRELHHFLACVRGDSLPQANSEAGLHTVRVLEAASRSLRAGGIRVAGESSGLRQTAEELAAAGD